MNIETIPLSLLFSQQYADLFANVSILFGACRCNEALTGGCSHNPVPTLFSVNNNAEVKVSIDNNIFHATVSSKSFELDISKTTIEDLMNGFKFLGVPLSFSNYVEEIKSNQAQIDVPPHHRQEPEISEDNPLKRNILYRYVPLKLFGTNIIPIFERYERERITELLANGRRVSVLYVLDEMNVTDPIRAFFYGHVFEWVTEIYEKYTQQDIAHDISRQEFGKTLLKAIWAKDSNDFEFYDGIRFSVDRIPISFSRNDSIKRIMEATDIWTKYFAELGEDFPIPDKEWRIKKEAQIKQTNKQLK